MNAVLVRILNLPPRSRRILALAILVAVSLAFSAAAARLIAVLRAEIANVTERRELIGQQELALKSMQVSIDNGKGINASLKEAFLQGDSEAVAEASLQSWMSDAAGNIGIEVNFIGGAEPSDDGTLRMIGVKTSMTGTYDRVLQLVAAIEAATPRLTVVKGEFLSSQDDMMGEDQAELRITANLTVMGVPAPETKRTEAGQ